MNAQQQLLSRYGIPDLIYQNKYCVIWNAIADFPWLSSVSNAATPDPNDHPNRIMINKDFKAKIFVAFTNIQKAGLQGEIETYDGCYNPREVRGKQSTSLHAWCAAIDMNASKERMFQHGTHWSGQFVAIMKAAGLFWGGDWPSRVDSMHFAMLNG